MKKSRILLTIICILAVIGGALGYKSSRIMRTFYLDTVTTVGGAPHSVCTVPTMYMYDVNPAGVRTIKASTASIDMTCPVISVSPGA
jgi:hypothetical protein